MDRPVGRIVIVGGGTAGWLAAATLAARLGARPAPPAITLIEAPDIPTVGVGEGTWPTFRATLADIGIDEAEFLSACNGSFKQGSRFDGWSSGAAGDSYLHPFTPPPSADPRDLVAAWRAAGADRPFASVVSAQAEICAQHLAPRQAAMEAYGGALNYAYHLDAGMLAALLRRHASGRLGVTHIADQVVGVEAGEDGDIAAVVTRDHGRVEGDLFLDCSGHAALLIGGHFGVKWIDRSDLMLNDRALALQIPVAPGSPIASQTVATAHEAGWIWDIGLPTRRGVGCVYASRFLDDEAAETILRAYLARTAPELDSRSIAPRRLVFPTGHRAEFWRANCLAIGLSAGFIEPLEASAIVTIELSLRALVDNFPESRPAMALHAARFNRQFGARWERIVDFLKLHYLLSRRDESYWRAQRDPATVPPGLAELVALWRDQPPSVYDLPLADEIFPAASYQYVLYGMRPEWADRAARRGDAGRVAPALEQIRQRARTLAAALPSNRLYLDRLAADGVDHAEGGRA
jgi:tryptophan halogenase